MTQHSPRTDKHLSIPGPAYSGDKFRDIRSKAIDEYQERCRKAKRNKEIKKPKYKPGDLVVLQSSGYKAKTAKYILIDVVDFDAVVSPTVYFGIVLKASWKYPRIGRLFDFNDSLYGCGSWGFRWRIVPVDPDSVRWCDEENDN